MRIVNAYCEWTVFASIRSVFDAVLKNSCKSTIQEHLGRKTVTKTPYAWCEF
jgi:hypothetical protein